MRITRVHAIPMSDPVPASRQHRTDLGTKVKSDATLIRVETDSGFTGIGAALGTPPIVGRDRLLEPGNVVRLELLGELDGGRDLKRAVRVDHQLNIGAEPAASCL